ncbi:MAG: hypothetical protein K5866_05790 [Treponema sp.]|nr:hypothetical protein [Treponema sp.]
MVEPLWSPPVGDAVFKRFNVEFIVRNNISENDYHFELIDSLPGNLLAAAFFTRKGDACKVEEWYGKHGFTLIEEGAYEPFSDEHGDYKTYIFKKKL